MPKADPQTARPRTTAPTQDLLSFVEDFPALFWRIERAKSRIEFLNDHALLPFGKDARLLLKSKDFRSKVVLPEDLNLVDTFFEAVKEGRVLDTVFRVLDSSDEIAWLKLTGATNSSDPRYYYGYLLDITHSVKLITGMLEDERTMHQRIANLGHPVLLIDHKTSLIKKANAAARELFRLDEALDGGNVYLRSLYPSSENVMVERIMDEIVFQQSWNGRLEFNTFDGEPMEADIIMRFIGWKKRPLVQISVVETPEQTAPSETEQNIWPAANGAGAEAARDLATRLKNTAGIEDMLDIALREPLVAKRCDAIMLSDIHVRKNKVYVYGAGEPLTSMPLGEEYSYKGTIAESIVRFGLDHLVVDDTTDSIKAIDWALFIPRGIRSYFAKPYFERKTLRSVLILCSQEPYRFENLTASYFDRVLSPLNEAARETRKSWAKR